MSKIKLVLGIVEDLRTLAVSIENLVKAMQPNETAPAETPVEPSKADKVTIEMLRSVLAEKSQGGMQPEVKALITKFGANKLTALDPACFEQLLAEALVL